MGAIERRHIVNIAAPAMEESRTVADKLAAADEPATTLVPTCEGVHCEQIPIAAAAVTNTEAAAAHDVEQDATFADDDTKEEAAGGNDSFTVTAATETTSPCATLNPKP